MSDKYELVCKDTLIMRLEEAEAERDALQAKVKRISQIHSNNDSQDQIIREIEQIIEGEE